MTEHWETDDYKRAGLQASIRQDERAIAKFHAERVTAWVSFWRYLAVLATVLLSIFIVAEVLQVTITRNIDSNERIEQLR